jgi:nitrate/TMAO reductase-like tetraheme cytochrome c subunit
MVGKGFARRWMDKAAHLAGLVFVLSMFGLAATTVAVSGAVHHTAQPEFCNSCHIMEPYYKSWQESKHKDVSCIECHYEPGLLETAEGKFKALSQLAKYVTRTQGTKPWAEVSDQSCLRSGCHAVSQLEGPIQFGNISFDHRQHLLESRRGRRLRCTTCHSQIVQDEHVSVTPSVCFSCHFMPGEDGKPPAKTSDCLICHGPPEDPVIVDGEPFEHDEYIERGVDCRECHNPVIEGDGTVRKERCHSCHSEIGHIERIGDTAFLHETHVTEHKVECFECHDEIHHGLLPLKAPAVAKKEGCGTCHESPHDAARTLYAGTGAVGVSDSPSRMYETRVVCEACHSGRSGQLVPGAAAHAGSAAHASIAATVPADASHAGAPLSGPHVGGVAAAGNVDCIHCHGTGYDGMSAQWQSAVSEQLGRLKPLLDELEAQLPVAQDQPARTLFEEARQNHALVVLDGSRGVHNVGYALDALRASAARIDQARELLGLPREPSAAADMPFHSKDGCTNCHAGAGRPAEVWPGERVFAHQKHLSAGLDCDACHSTTEHGKPSFPREQCASCHHQESESRDVSDCASCHAAQAEMLSGAVPGFEPKPGPMSSMECSECHGEAPTVLRPKPSACLLCHAGTDYDKQFSQWKLALSELGARVEAALSAAHPALDAAVLERARQALEAVRRDGSGGAHDFELAERLLRDALAALEQP